MSISHDESVNVSADVGVLEFPEQLDLRAAHGGDVSMLEYLLYALEPISLP
jgi:hypothetical protein